MAEVGPYTNNAEANSIAQSTVIAFLPTIEGKIDERIVNGFQSAIDLTSPAPTKPGVYVASESGTYPNYGGLTGDITQGRNEFYLNPDGTFTKNVVPANVAGFLADTDIGLYQSKNLYNSASNTNGYVNGTNGTIVLTPGDTTKQVSDFIKVAANTQYTISGRTDAAGGVRGFVYYETNKQLIANPPYYTDTANATVTTPVNAAYVRFTASYGAGDTPTAIQFEVGTTATAYVPYFAALNTIKDLDIAASFATGLDGTKIIDDYINDKIEVANTAITEGITEAGEVSQSFAFVQPFLPKSFSSNLAHAQATYTASGIVFNNPNYDQNNVFADTISGMVYSCSKKFRREDVIQVTTTNFGYSCGLSGANAYTFYIKFIDGALRTVAMFYNRQTSSPAPLLFDPNLLPASVNDFLKITTAFQHNVFTAKVENLTQPKKVPFFVSYTYPYVVAPPLAPASNVMDTNVFDGGFKLISIKRFIPKADTVFVGDSITHGYAVGGTDPLKTYSGIIFGKIGNSYNVMAAPGGTTADILFCMSEIKAAANQTVNVMLGANDVITQVPVSTYISNMKKIIYTLQNMGKNVILCKITPLYASYAPSSDVRPYNAALDTEFSGKLTIVDTFTPLADSNGRLLSQYDSGDAIHPNAAGNQVIADYILGYDPSVIAYGNGGGNLPANRYLLS
jgi:lysophospholipase L1-like esterase